jgi:predicted MPP superfamily phosphohydrolase
MSRFIIIALTIFGVSHFYVWERLVRAPELGAPWFALLSAAVVLAWLSIPATFVLGRRARAKGGGGFWVWPGYVWLGTLFLLLVSVLASDLARLGFEIVERLRGIGPVDAATALARSRLQAGLAAGTAAILLLVALSSARRLSVKRVLVPLARLPQALDGMTIVQLTDVHIGPTLGRHFLERVVAAVNALKPDLIAITGDLVDGPVLRLTDAIAPLSDLKARHGVYFVTGNHEYYAGADSWCAHLTSLGLRVLRNERVVIGSGEESFDLAGVDDISARHFGPGQGADLERALLGRDESRELVLLAHQPRLVQEAERAGVGLQLSGHTHGGQIWPFNFLVRLQQPVTAGLVRFGRALIYVSSGTGYWGPPMRLGSRAEISLLTLQAPGGAAPSPA